MEPFEEVGCLVKELPSTSRQEAMARAIEVNPQNAPQYRFPARTLALVESPDHLALLTGKRWGQKVRLGVRFLDISSASLKAKILSYANKWGQYGDIQFAESGQGEIRLSTGGGGYWSYLGTDILGVGGPTMNLQGFSLGTPESEYDRVVVHEFGHSLGFPHEHARKKIIDLLDFEKTVQEFMRTQGWSRQTVIQQILTPISEATVTANSEDVHSIMCYSFSGRCTKSGEPIPGGKVITDHDAELVRKVYPKTDVPPPPPPPPPAGAIAFKVAVAEAEAAMRAAGYTVTKGVPTEAEVRAFVEAEAYTRTLIATAGVTADIDWKSLITQIILAWLKSRG